METAPIKFMKSCDTALRICPAIAPDDGMKINRLKFKSTAQSILGLAKKED